MVQQFICRQELQYGAKPCDGLLYLDRREEASTIYGYLTTKNPTPIGRGVRQGVRVAPEGMVLYTLGSSDFGLI